MRWMTMTAVALMAMACGVEEPADVSEADDQARMFEEMKDADELGLDVVISSPVPNCNKKPWSSSRRCRPGGEQVQSTAGSNPEGHDPIELKINGGLLYGRLDERTGGVIISFDEAGENVAAEVYGVGDVEYLGVTEALDDWEPSVSNVSVEIVTKDGMAVSIPNIVDFETEAGFGTKR